jgi:nucleoside-diphosphate-sugar epimerase
MAKTKKIVVTGGSGFFGQHLIKRLLKEKNSWIINFDTNPPCKSQTRVTYIAGDVTKKSQIIDACKGADIVFHTAALVPVSRAGKLFREVNVEGTRNVLEACLKNKVKKVVHISSSSVYGIPSEFPITEETKTNPLGEYASTKLSADKLCFSYIRRGLNISILRPRTLVGEGRLGILAVMFDLIMMGKRVYLVGSGKNYFQLISPVDLVEACILASKPEVKGLFNVGAEKYNTLREDLGSLVNVAKTRSRIVSCPPRFIRSVLSLLGLLRLSPFVAWHYLTLDKNYAFDISKAKRELGWKPKHSNLDCLKKAYFWYLNNHNQLREGTNHSSIPKQRLTKLIRLLS